MPPSFNRSAYLPAAPRLFDPDQSWSKGPYRYFLDTKRRICKQVPVDLQLQLTTEPRFFRMQPAVIEQVVADTAAVQRQLDAPRLRRAYYRFRNRAPWYRLAARACVTLALVAITIAVYPWVPEAQWRLQQAIAPAPTQTAISSAQSFTQPAPTTQNRLVIPKIGVDTAVLAGADLSVLDTAEGVWNQKGQVGEGNYVLAGHRFKYLPPNTTTLYNLDKLEVGDVAMVDHEGTRRTYQVQSKQVVPASQVSVLNQTNNHQLTIYTCNDVRETQRIVVVATPIQTPAKP